MTTVFFYGLFMDKELLKGKGLNPENVRRAYLRDYQLQIGERATLLPCEGACSYGTVMEVDSTDLHNLYSSSGVEDYVPQTVKATTMAGEAVEAVSYILPVEKISGSNSQYAIELARIVKKLDFPDHYIEEIEAWS